MARGAARGRLPVPCWPAFVHTFNSYEGIPLPVLLLLVLLGVFSYIARQTVFGRRIYAVGSNMEATRLSGIDVRKP